MKAMIARYPGNCGKCGQAIFKGDPINFFGRGRVEHQQCNGEDSSDPDVDEYREGGFPPSRSELENDRKLARRGISVTRFSSGETMTQNSRGRCIDAPCCGCCS